MVARDLVRNNLEGGFVFELCVDTTQVSWEDLRKLWESILEIIKDRIKKFLKI